MRTTESLVQEHRGVQGVALDGLEAGVADARCGPIYLLPCISKVYTMGVDVLYRHRSQTFLWNAAKAIENRSKHGVSFEEVCEAFFDEASVYVDATADDEPRSALIGITDEGKIVYVVHLVQGQEVIRIILARRATRKEEELYEDG
jgi:uncharacterized DUF497 family protein